MVEPQERTRSGVTAHDLVALALSCGLGAAVHGACSSAPLEPLAEPVRPLSAASASASVQTAPVEAPAPPAITPLVAPDEVALEAALRPVAGEYSALLVHSDLLRGISWVRRIDAAGVGSVRTLRGRQVVGALDAVFDGASAPLLVSSDGERLCFEPFAAGSAGKVQCHALRADAMALMPDGEPALLMQRAVVVEEPDRADDDAPTEMRIWLQRLTSEGKLDGERIDTELVFPRPLVGMGLIDAVGTSLGVRLLWYEHLERRGRERQKRAALKSARLDRDGKLVAASRTTLLSGERGYGDIVGHSDLQLMTRAGRAIFVGRFRDDGRKVDGYQGMRLGPSEPMVAPNAVFATDPLRLVDARALDDAELVRYQAIWEAAPRLVPGQSPDDAGRVAWVGERGWFLGDDGTLRSVARKHGEIADEAPPFTARRGALHWATMAEDGAAIALTSRGLVQVDADGSVSVQPTGSDLAAPLAPPVRIGARWWLLASDGSRTGARLSRVGDGPSLPAELGDHAYADHAALVGGASDGLFLALRHGALRVWRLSADGQATALARYASPLRDGFVASARPGGGAYLAGDDGRRSLVAVIDERGQLLGAHASPIPTGPLALVSHPAGAWLFDARRSQVSWLDGEGRSLAHATWPAEDNGAACIDGSPIRRLYPASAAGSFVALATANACASSELFFGESGVRWIGTLVDGIHSAPVLFRLPPVLPRPASGQAIARADGPLAPARAPTTESACPPDMVRVSGQLCVDRYEGQLVDAGSGIALSPDWPTSPNLVKIIHRRWVAARWRVGDLHAQAMPLPALLRLTDATPAPLARSRRDVVPSGYVSGHVAKAACEAAGKRLCTSFEWEQACRGEENRPFPYGDSYVHEACNVFRYSHPASRLHDNPSIGHLDPRLNRVHDGGEPMLRPTGATPRCASTWGNDAIYDMVGNLDEWVETKSGGFAGGFYSRGTRKGCGSLITAHPRRYQDYSLGIRCCLDPSTRATATTADPDDDG